MVCGWGILSGSRSPREVRRINPHQRRADRDRTSPRAAPHPSRATPQSRHTPPRTPTRTTTRRHTPPHTVTHTDTRRHTPPHTAIPYLTLLAASRCLWDPLQRSVPRVHRLGIFSRHLCGVRTVLPWAPHLPARGVRGGARRAEPLASRNLLCLSVALLHLTLHLESVWHHVAAMVGREGFGWKALAGGLWLHAVSCVRHMHVVCGPMPMCVECAPLPFSAHA